MTGADKKWFSKCKEMSEFYQGVKNDKSKQENFIAAFRYQCYYEAISNLDLMMKCELK